MDSLGGIPFFSPFFLLLGGLGVSLWRRQSFPAILPPSAPFWSSGPLINGRHFFANPAPPLYSSNLHFFFISPFDQLFPFTPPSFFLNVPSSPGPGPMANCPFPHVRAFFPTNKTLVAQSSFSPTPSFPPYVCKLSPPLQPAPLHAVFI